ncbi:MAG: hypothetical protein ABR956_17860 [Terracidiphilus sp.]|jgi:hypothetical protein
MRYRSILIAAVFMIPVVAWTVSKDFNGRMWLAQVPALPTNANAAYSQFVDDGNGTLKPGEAFTNVTQGINNVIADQAKANMASSESQSQQQQQLSMAQQMQAKYGTPEGQAALRAMTPAQLMALAQQMQPQTSMPGVVSPQDQQLLQKIDNGVYSGKQAVMADVLKLQQEVNGVYTQWDQALAALAPQQQAQFRQLPPCPGEASIPSSQDQKKLELKFADERIAIASQYLGQIAPIVGKARAAVLPEIDFDDDALAAWTQISDAALKQQVSASAHGAQQQGLGDVGIVEQMVEQASSKAAQAEADKKAIQKKYANARGC